MPSLEHRLSSTSTPALVNSVMVGGMLLSKILKSENCKMHVKMCVHYSGETCAYDASSVILAFVHWNLDSVKARCRYFSSFSVEVIYMLH